MRKIFGASRTPKEPLTTSALLWNLAIRTFILVVFIIWTAQTPWPWFILMVYLDVMSGLILAVGVYAGLRDKRQAPD